MNGIQPVELLDRRVPRTDPQPVERERRQFTESRTSFSPEVQELADAIDAYKQAHGRRHVTLAEVLHVFQSLGYHK